jgi:hypothetical protein
MKATVLLLNICTGTTETEGMTLCSLVYGSYYVTTEHLYKDY